MIETNKHTKKSILWGLSWLSDKLNSISIILVVALMLSMTIIVLAQVFSRYILKNSITWSEEIARWLMIWICFLGSGIAVKYSQHIGLSFIVDRLNKKVQNIFSLLTNTGILIFLYFCILKSFTLTQFVINQKTAAAQISMAWPYSSVPIGCMIMLVHIIVIIFENLKNFFSKDFSKEETN